MSEIAYDFTAYRVLVVGGTRGAGLEIARTFADSGASVCVTGTLMLAELYDADLSSFEYEMVNLARQESIDNLADALGEVDIAVVCAGANLPYALPASERDFIGGAVLSGLLGPGYLARKLRLRLAQSPAPGGGSMVFTGAARRWWEIAQDPADAAHSLTDFTARTAQSWATIGARINTVLEPAAGSSFLPRQFSRPATPSTRGDVLVREQPKVQRAVTDATMFLAGESAARLNGQVLQLG